MKIKYLPLVLLCGMIVLSCDNGATSTNGTDDGSNPNGSWRDATISTFNGDIYGFAYGNDTFVAVGGSTGNPQIARSTNNGTSWTVINIESQTGSGNNPSAIAFGNGKFITMGSLLQAHWSTDGAGWTDVGSYYIGQCIIHNDGVFIIGRDSGVDRLLDTSDTWESVNMGSIYHDTRIRNIAYGEGTFLTVGGVVFNNNQRMARSTNKGASWTEVTDSTLGTILGNNNIQSMAYGEGTFIAVGDGGKVVRSTDKGESWTEITSATFGTSDFRTIAYGKGIFIAGGDDGKMVSSTDNGSTWTIVSNNTTGDHIHHIFFGNDRFLATGWTPGGGKIAILTVN
ncbi:MAG: hypothetical protein FWH12_08835 [Treponema sp.]|nr:hypothetical protein [Treponema sp.]